MKPWLVAGCVTVVVAFANSGCGDDEGDLFGKYSESVEAAMRRAEERTAEEASQPFDGESVKRRADILRDLRDDLGEIVPPSEMAAEHKALRDAVGNLSAHIDELLGRVAQANSEAELDALNEDWLNNPRGNELEDRVRVACIELQEAADAREMGVDLCYEAASRE